MWTLAVLIILVGVGSYAFLSDTPAATPEANVTTATDTNNLPNPGGVGGTAPTGEVTTTPPPYVPQPNSTTTATVSTTPSTVHISQ
jgi:hypothetical protein